MKSRVIFALVTPIPIPISQAIDYPSLGARAEMNGNCLCALSVEIEHKSTAAPSLIAEKAREALRDVTTLLGVGRGFEPPLGSVHIELLTTKAPEEATGLLQLKLNTAIARNLTAMPEETLVQRLASDHRLRRQAEALNAAKSAADLVTRIRWAYQVLEQERKRNPTYRLLPNFRHIRNAMSHPEINQSGKNFFKKALGVDMLDLRKHDHIQFLRVQGENLLKEANRIVESNLADKRFWA